MRPLIQYIYPYKRLFIFSILTSIINKVADLMPPLLVGWIINTAIGESPVWINSWFGINDVFGALTFLSLGIIIVFAFESAFEWLYQLGFMNLAQHVQHDLRLTAYNHLQSREIAYFEEQRTGNIMTMLNDDINQLERFLNASFNDIIQLITLFVFAFIVLFGLSFKLTLIGIIPIPLIIIGSFYYQKMIAPFYLKIRNIIGELSSRLENNISGILVVKSFTAEKFESERVNTVSQNYREANKRAIKYNAAYVPIIRIFIGIGFAFVMLLGSYWVVEGKGDLQAGDLAIFGMMIQRVLWPMTRLGRIFDDYARTKASAKRIFGLLAVSNSIKEIEHPIELNGIQQQIECSNIQFNYYDGQPVLKGLSFSVQAGQTIGIAGTTGAGKTTLIKLLLRLYDTTSGSISIDGRNIRTLSIKSLRRQIALVSQDVYLFHGSIEENIAYGLENVSIKAIKDAAKQAKLHDFIASLNDQYKTIVGERGIKLSGGQRQRLSIARAILKNAPIIILDEATSAVDTETERAIQENLHLLTQGRTAFIIAHRLSTIRKADNIIVLENGKVIESGTHSDLISNAGTYAGLWKVQTGQTDS